MRGGSGSGTRREGGSSKGSKAVWILGPVRKKVKASKEALNGQVEPNEEGFKEILVGFKAIPVFRYEDTYGRDLPVYEPKNPPPLLEVAERFGMKVQYERLAPGVYGATDHTNKTIVLATEDWDVFFHELGHAIHRTFEPKSGHGQEPEAETIAQLVAATLARLYDSPADSFSWSYIASYAQSNNPQTGRKALHARPRQNQESPRPDLRTKLSPIADIIHIRLSSFLTRPGNRITELSALVVHLTALVVHLTALVLHSLRQP